MAVMTVPQSCAAGTPTIPTVVGGAFFPDPAWFSLVGTAIGITDVLQQLAILFIAPRTGTVTHIEWLGTTTAGNRTLTLEGIGTDGFPDGVVAATHQQNFGAVAVNAWNAAGPYSPSFSVTAGQPYAVRFVMNAAGSMQLHGWNGWYGSFKLPYQADRNIASVWGKSIRPPSLILRYDDGQRECVRDTHPALEMLGTPTLFNSGSTPDERGIRFVSPFSGLCQGAVFFVEIDAPATATLTLYDGSDAVLASHQWAATDHVAGDGFWAFTRWTASVTLTAGATYRLTMTPDGANDIGVYQWTYDTAHESLILGKLTTRTGGGAWTDTDGTSLHAALEMETFA